MKTPDYFYALSASADDLALACGLGVATASPALPNVTRLVENPGFLQGLMLRVKMHFANASEGPVRVLRNGGVWLALLNLCIAAIALRFGVRNLRHFGMQPFLGKLRVFSVAASFFAFIGAFIGFFKKIAMAWKQETEADVEKRKAADLLAGLSEAERAVLLAQAGKSAEPATAALTVLASALRRSGSSVSLLSAVQH